MGFEVFKYISYGELIRLIVCLTLDGVEYVIPFLLTPFVGDIYDMVALVISLYMFGWFGLISYLDIKIASQDNAKGVREQALRAICATGEESVIETLVEMIRNLPDEEYKTSFSDNIWSLLVNRGLGPPFRSALFKEFLRSSDKTRERIEEITRHRYLG